MAPRILTLEPGMEYCAFSDTTKGEYWICSEYNGAPLFRCSYDTQYILHLLNTGKYHVTVEEVVRQDRTTREYYKVWEYRMV